MRHGKDGLSLGRRWIDDTLGVGKWGIEPDHSVSAGRGDFLHVGHPGHDQNSVPFEGWLEVFDLVQSCDPTGTEFHVPFESPTQCRRMCIGSILHPLHVDDVVDMPEHVDVRCPNLDGVFEDRCHCRSLIRAVFEQMEEASP